MDDARTGRAGGQEPRAHLAPRPEQALRGAEEAGWFRIRQGRGRLSRQAHRTRYSITAKGRRALAAWVAKPGTGPALEFEQLVKIHFCDSGTKQDILDNLAAAVEWAQERNDENLAVGRAYLEGQGLFPQRAAVNALGGRFLTEFYAMVADWATWATEIVEEWPDDVADAVYPRDEMERTVRTAQRIADL